VFGQLLGQICRRFGHFIASTFGQAARQKSLPRFIALLGIILLLLSSLAPPALAAFGRGKSAPATTALPKTAAKPITRLAEAAPPIAIQTLGEAFEENQPRVSILSPKPNEILQSDRVSVRFQVNDLPIFKSKTLGLGPHLHVLLDNQPYQAVYDLNQPLELANLQPGTHTLRAFASRPWHESFKNEGAYAQTTFHVYTKTQENSPSKDLPLLTYSRPQGSYGAEPILLDFYLTNAPLHLVAREDQKDSIPDWRVRYTVNGTSFIVDEWKPIYLKGFQPGANWVQIELLDENGNPISNLFNNTARLVTYEPNGSDTLAKLVRGDLPIETALAITDPNYKPPVRPVPPPPPVETPSPDASPSAAPSDQAPVPALPVSPVPPMMPTSPEPKPAISPSPTPSPAAPISPQPTNLKPAAPAAETAPPSTTQPKQVAPPEVPPPKLEPLPTNSTPARPTPPALVAPPADQAPPVKAKPIEPKPPALKPAGTKPIEVTPTTAKAIEAKSAEAEPIEAKPTEPKLTQIQPVEPNPPALKPADAKPAESKSADAKSAEPKPTETKPTETKPAETKPIEPKPVEAQPSPLPPSDTQPSLAQPAPAVPVKPPVAEPAPSAQAPNSKASDTVQTLQKNLQTKATELRAGFANRFSQWRNQVQNQFQSSGTPAAPEPIPNLSQPEPVSPEPGLNLD
jgi:hypothetical protein